MFNEFIIPKVPLYIGVQMSGIWMDISVVDATGREILKSHPGPRANRSLIGIAPQANNLEAGIIHAANACDCDADPGTIGGVVINVADANPAVDEYCELRNSSTTLEHLSLHILPAGEIALYGVKYGGTAVAQISDIRAETHGRYGVGVLSSSSFHGRGGNPGSSVEIAYRGTRLAQKHQGSDFSEKLRTAFRVKSLDELTTNLAYLTNDFTRFREIINRAVDVMAHEAYLGNPMCHQIFVDAANSLARSTMEMGERIGIRRRDNFQLNLSGSTWSVGDILIKPYLDRVMDGRNAEVLILAESPAQTAARIAFEVCSPSRRG